MRDLYKGIYISDEIPLNLNEGLFSWVGGLFKKRENEDDENKNSSAFYNLEQDDDAQKEFLDNFRNFEKDFSVKGKAYNKIQGLRPAALKFNNILTSVLLENSKSTNSNFAEACIEIMSQLGKKLNISESIDELASGTLISTYFLDISEGTDFTYIRSSQNSLMKQFQYGILTNKKYSSDYESQDEDDTLYSLIMDNYTKAFLRAYKIDANTLKKICEFDSSSKEYNALSSDLKLKRDIFIVLDKYIFDKGIFYDWDPCYEVRYNAFSVMNKALHS